MPKLKLLALIVAGNALLASSRTPGYSRDLVLGRGKLNRDERNQVDPNDPANTEKAQPTTAGTTGTTTTDSTWVLNEFPWVAGLAADGDHVICTGVLVHKQWVMTTALCVNLNVGKVIYGARKQLEDKVAHSVRHPYFRYETNKSHIISMYNDIGLLYMKKGVDNTEYLNKNQTDEIPMAKAHLPFGVIDYRDQVVTVFGYGLNKKYKRSLPKKSQLFLQMCMPAKWAYAHCGCKVNQLVNVSYCAADSGAPVLVNGLLVGLATLAPHNCRQTHIMTFNSVYEHLPWVFYTAKLFKEIYESTAVQNAEVNCYLTILVSIAVVFTLG